MEVVSHTKHTQLWSGPELSSRLLGQFWTQRISRHHSLTFSSSVNAYSSWAQKHPPLPTPQTNLTGKKQWLSWWINKNNFQKIQNKYVNKYGVLSNTNAWSTLIWSSYISLVLATLTLGVYKQKAARGSQDKSSTKFGIDMPRQTKSLSYQAMLACTHTHTHTDL